MTDFTYETSYVENVGIHNAPIPAYGVINGEIVDRVNPEEVVKGKDDPSSPDGVSLPEGADLTVSFGDYSVVDGPGPDIELKSFGSATQTARFEFLATAYYENGESIHEFVSFNRQSGGGSSVLIDLDDVNFENKDQIAFITTSSLVISGTGREGDSPGFEVYEVEAKNSVRNSEISQEISRITNNRDPLTGQPTDIFDDFPAEEKEKNILNKIASGDINLDGDVDYQDVLTAIGFVAFGGGLFVTLPYAGFTLATRLGFSAAAGAITTYGPAQYVIDNFVLPIIEEVGEGQIVDALEEADQNFLNQQ